MKLTWPPRRLKYRHTVAIPVAVSAVLLLVLLFVGLPIGRDFKGGSLVMVREIEKVPDIDSLKLQAESITGSFVNVTPTYNGFDIETERIEGNVENQIRNMLLTSFGIGEDSITIGTLGPVVSGAKVVQILVLSVGALVVMAVIVLIFRRAVAAGAVLITAGLDILGILGLMALFQVPVGLASIIGILVTFGYAIDTNSLLSSRLLKGAVGDPRENTGESLRAGLVTGAVALSILLSVSILITASQMKELTLAIIFGIIVNILNTWFLGAVIILRHVERKRVVSYHVSV